MSPSSRGLNLGPGPRDDSVPPLPRYIGKEVVCRRDVGKVVCCTGAIAVTTVGDTGDGIVLSDKPELLPLLDDDSTELWRIEPDEVDDDEDKGGAIGDDELSDELDDEPLIDN